MIIDKIKDVYKNFNPLMPLPGISEFYVNRKNNPLNKIKTDLLRDNEIPLKILFSGHRGSGKSTELNKLMAYTDIQEKYFIIYYSVKEVLDTADLNYVDLLISIGVQIFVEANKKGLKIKDSLLNELNIFKDILETEEEKTRAIGGEGSLSLIPVSFFSQILMKLKLEHTNREKIRKKAEPRLSEIIDIINQMVRKIKLESNQEVLVAIDDLDKPDLATAEEIFYKKYIYLTQPECNIIYTIPIAMHYSTNFGQVRQSFTYSYVLPNVTIKNQDHSQNEEGRSLMKTFVGKRMSLDLIDSEALEYAVDISGGVFREMVRIIKTAADEAESRDDDNIKKQDVEIAGTEIRNEFRRMLRKKDYEALKEIHEKCEIEDSETNAELMHNLSVLEYRNGENWCDVHPAIIPLIEKE